MNPFGLSQSTGITSFESLIGRPLAITRHYLTWNIPLSNSTIKWSASAGHIPYVAWHATKKGNVAVPWASITTGTEDAWITTQAQSARSAGYPMYLTFHHEPEDDQANGSAADFVAAYDHVRSIFDATGVTNVTWVVTLMASTYGGGHGGHGAWLPASFDLLGVDGYNRHPCIASPDKHPWRSFAEIFAAAHDASVSSGIPLFVGENGCVEAYDCGDTAGDPAAKAQWLTDQGATLKSWPEVKAILYSHTTCTHNGYPMEHRVDSSASSFAAYTAVGLDAYFLASVWLPWGTGVRRGKGCGLSCGTLGAQVGGSGRPAGKIGDREPGRLRVSDHPLALREMPPARPHEEDREQHPSDEDDRSGARAHSCPSRPLLRIPAETLPPYVVPCVKHLAGSLQVDRLHLPIRTVKKEDAGRLPTDACWKRRDRAEPLGGGDGPGGPERRGAGRSGSLRCSARKVRRSLRVAGGPGASMFFGLN